MTTPQIPPPHLPIRTFASPAWVSQTPWISGPACALVASAPSSAVTSTMKVDLQLMMPSDQAVPCIAANGVSAISDRQRRLIYPNAQEGSKVHKKDQMR